MDEYMAMAFLSFKYTLFVFFLTSPNNKTRYLLTTFVTRLA